MTRTLGAIYKGEERAHDFVCRRPPGSVDRVPACRPPAPREDSLTTTHTLQTRTPAAPDIAGAP